MGFFSFVFVCFDWLVGFFRVGGLVLLFFTIQVTI